MVYIWKTSIQIVFGEVRQLCGLKPPHPSNTKDNTCCYIYLLPQRRQLLTVLYAKTTKWKHLNLAYKHWFYISIYNDSNKSNLHKNHTGLSFFFFRVSSSTLWTYFSAVWYMQLLKWDYTIYFNKTSNMKAYCMWKKHTNTICPWFMFGRIIPTLLST